MESLNNRTEQTEEFLNLKTVAGLVKKPSELKANFRKRRKPSRLSGPQEANKHSHHPVFQKKRREDVQKTHSMEELLKSFPNLGQDSNPGPGSPKNL